MPKTRFYRAILPLMALFPLAALRAQSEPIMLASPSGAAIAFSQFEDGWRWTGLVTPAVPGVLREVSDRNAIFATPEGEAWLERNWELMASDETRVVLEQTVPDLGLRVRRVFAFGPAGNVLRVETWARSLGGQRTLSRIGLLQARVDGETFWETGLAPASFPLFGEFVFAGIEHVSGEARTAGNTIELVQRPRLVVGETWEFAAAAIVGWPQPERSAGLGEEERMREAFLQYLDSVRIKPDRIVLHSETWWTLPPPLLERNVLNDIERLKRDFLDRTGMFFDTYCLDLGWSHPKTFWEIDPARFPSDFRAVNERLGQLGTKLGLWMSPGSGYPDGLDNKWLGAQGYEMTPFDGFPDGAPCFALGGRYQRDFKEKLLGYARQYGLGHVILDFMPQYCDEASHGHPVGEESRYAIDAGVADVLDALRVINPNIALEPMVCGYPPSPWWLMKTPFILGPAGDDMPYGRVASPDWMESLITARDIAYREGQPGWLMPTQALETWDIILQTPGDFENLAVMAIGRGRWFLSSYIKPELMEPEDWDFFAALVRWARHNKQYLTNASQFGGRPEDRDAYGYVFRNPDKAIYCVRNPWIEEREIELPPLPGATEARDVLMVYPRRAAMGRLEPGSKGLRIAVAPYETIMLETVPVDASRPDRAVAEPPQAVVIGDAPRLVPVGVSEQSEDARDRRYYWGGTVSVPEVQAAELCILVEGAANVERAECRIAVGGRELVARKTGSAGQFAAATDVYPENWTWFIVPLPAGNSTVQIDLTVPVDDASIGVYVRGSTSATNDLAPSGDAPVFPIFNPTRRAWSQTLVPLAHYPATL